MAYDFMSSAMGFGPQAFETEEERRRRLEAEANAEVSSQTVKTYGDGTQETITKSVTPAGGPVAPQDLTGAVRTAESGNRDFDQAGRPITSPKGAMFGMQVMPATAQQPGFGIRPAADQSPEEYNRVGQEYLAAMQKRYPDQPEAAIAAYNMGPGAVDRNIQQNQGRFNLGAAPKETQGYVPRVMSMAEKALNAMVPSAQAAPAPVAPPGMANTAAEPRKIVPPGQMVNLGDSRQTVPAAPTAPVAPETAPSSAPVAAPPVATAAPVTPQPSIQTDDEGNQLITTATGQTYSVGPDGRPLANRGVALEQFGFGRKLIDAQKDNDSLYKLSLDQTASEAERKLAKDIFFERYETNKAEQKAKEIGQKAYETGNFRELDREMRKPGNTGDWLKYLWFKAQGYEEAATNVADRLGITDTYQTVTLPDGKTQASVRFGTTGLAKSGVDANGRALTAEQLNTLTGYSTMMKGAQVGTSTFTDPVTKETLSKVDTPQGPIWFNKARQRVIPQGEPIPNTTGANISVQTELANLRIRENIIKKGINNIQDAKRTYIEQQGPFGTERNPISEQQFEQMFAGQLSIGVPGVGGGQTTAGTTTTAPAAAGTTTTAPAAAGGATTTTKPAPGTPGSTSGGYVTKTESEDTKKIREQQARNANQARSIAPFVAQIRDLIPKTTSSGLGSIVDQTAGFFGASPGGADAIAAMAPLADKILKTVERFEGPQSDIDVKSYKEAAGKLNDPKVPSDQKKAAFDTIIEILKRNAPELDWNLAGQVKTIDGKAYQHDGTGWKEKR